MQATCRRGFTCACTAVMATGLLTPHGCYAGRDPHYDLFSALHGRQHADAANYQRRLMTYRSNALHIVGHNADSAKPYRMAINRFADWTEVRALRSPAPAELKGILHTDPLLKCRKYSAVAV